MFVVLSLTINNSGAAYLYSIILSVCQGLMSFVCRNILVWPLWQTLHPYIFHLV